MARLYLLAAVVSLGLCVYSLIDIVRRGEGEIRHLPKLGWIVLVLLFPFVGSVAWLVVGRTPRTPPTRLQTQFPEYDRPGRASGLSEQSDEDFLAQVRERAERQREAYRRQQREAEKAAHEAEEERRRRRRGATDPEATEPGA
ncbi:hypothetical protein GCM10027425_20140 [Alteromonas gracilis]